MKFRINREILIREEEGKLIAFNPDRGEPFILEGTAVDIWGLLDEPMDLDELMGKLLESYEEDQRARVDVKKFLDSLVGEGLLDVL